MEAPARESKPITPYLPNREYKYLKIWFEILETKDTLKDYYISLHNKIEADDYAELTSKEAAVLSELFKSKIINKHNLYDYFINFEKTVNKPSVYDKLHDTIKKDKPDIRYLNVLAATDTKEDLALKKERFRVFKLSNTIYKAFQQEDYLGADQYYKDDPTLIDIPTYEKIKGSKVQPYIAENYLYEDSPLELSTSQAEALCNMGQVALLNSRAGTGKTYVLMAKILFSIVKENIKPNEISILSFDRNQTENIISTLTEIKPKSSPGSKNLFEGILSFDQLLSDITGISKGIVHEEKDSIFLDILENEKQTNPDFGKAMYNYYYQDNLKIDKKSFRNLSIYYKCISNSSFFSLKGEAVKTLGEKWIADFLYENGIEYIYKKAYYPSSIITEDRIITDLIQRGTKVIYPDFFLPKYNLLIEYSNINENEPDERNKVEFEKIHGENWGHYRIRMQWKRDFWDKWRKDINNDETKDEIVDIKAVDKMVEISQEQMVEGRDKFVEHLEKLLKTNNIDVKKKDSKSLIDDIWKRNKSDFTRLITSFCNRYQCSAINDEKEFAQKSELLKDFQNITQFYELGLKIKEIFENNLKKKSKIPSCKDFDIDQNQMVLEALKIVEKGDADSIVKKLRLIAIDDFQDFTQGYYKLILAMISRNPDLKVFAVGDNWQTLYREKGSDSIFIEKPQDYFKDIRIKEVQTNYRCKGSVTQNSNKLMKRNAIPGMPAQSFDNDYTKSVFIVDVTRESKVDELLIEKGLAEKEDETLVVSELGDIENKQILTKYIHKCLEEIKENKDLQILLIHKNLNIFGLTITEYINELTKSLILSGIYSTPEQAQEHISFSLINDTKPLLTDVAIFLQFTNDVLPTINSKSGLFEAFGENLLVNLTDQKRELYVAMTRVKKNIYILTEKDKESDFLEYLK
jgi:DNA helicase-4